MLLKKEKSKGISAYHHRTSFANVNECRCVFSWLGFLLLWLLCESWTWMLDHMLMCNAIKSHSSECEFVLPSSATKSRNRLLVFLCSARHFLTSVQPWPFLLIYLLSLFQLCTILFIIDWCLRFALFLLHDKVIHKGMISPLFIFIFLSWPCIRLKWHSIVEVYSYVSQKIWVFLLKAIRSVDNIFDSTIRPSVLAFCSVWLIYWTFLFISSRGIRLWPKAV